MTRPAYKPIEECKTVAELLEDPNRWCRGAFAKDKDGLNEFISVSTAVRWCVLGAISRIYKYPANNRAIELLREEIKPHKWISGWQDSPDRTHAEILAVVTRLGL